MSGRLAGKAALIIGAARGIGAGIAERFHEEGARLVIADTEVEARGATAERLKGKFVQPTSPHRRTPSAPSQPRSKPLAIFISLFRTPVSTRGR